MAVTAGRHIATIQRRLDYLEREGVRRRQLNTDHPAMREAAALRWAINVIRDTLGFGEEA